MIDHNAQGWRLNTWKEVKKSYRRSHAKGKYVYF